MVYDRMACRREARGGGFQGGKPLARSMAAKAWSMGVQRESEVSLGLGVQGGHEGPPWSWVRGMKSPRSGPRAESPGRGDATGVGEPPCQDERGRSEEH